MVFSHRVEVSTQNSIAAALGVKVSRAKGLSGRQKGAELFKSTAVLLRNPGESATDSREFSPGDRGILGSVFL
jgi:hypothetical protein